MRFIRRPNDETQGEELDMIGNRDVQSSLAKSLDEKLGPFRKLVR